MAQAAAGFATPGHEQGVPAWAAAAAAAVRQAVIMPVARQRFNIYLCLTRVRVLLHPFCSPTVGLQQMQLVNSWARLAVARSPWKRKSGTPPAGGSQRQAGVGRLRGGYQTRGWTLAASCVANLQSSA